MADPHLRLRRSALLGAVDGLRRGSLLEPGERQSSFALQSAVLEYVTEQLIDDALRELQSCDLDQLLIAPLVKATARELVRQSQERLIAAPLLERFVAGQGTVSADGRLAAGDGFEGTVNLWQAPGGQRLMMLPGHVGGALDVALSEDGRLVASGSQDEIVRLWDVASAALLASMHGHTGQVYVVALLGHDRLVSGSIDETVRLWQLSSGACTGTLCADRRYERLDISGVTGITEAQREALIALGATEQANSAALPSSG